MFMDSFYINCMQDETIMIENISKLTTDKNEESNW